MRVVNEDLLQAMRKRPCDICGKRPPSEAVHVFAKQRGGASVLEVAFNLASGCRQHHQSHHDGNEPKLEEWLSLVARRVGMSIADITERIYRMRRADKTCALCPDCEGTGRGHPDCGRCGGVGILTQSGDPFRST